MKKMENKKTADSETIIKQFIEKDKDDNADINQYLTPITKEIRDTIHTMIMDAYGKSPYKSLPSNKFSFNSHGVILKEGIHKWINTNIECDLHRTYNLLQVCIISGDLVHIWQLGNRNFGNYNLI